MEQTNLVVTADGKTWDEVTRGVSYIGPSGFNVSRDGGDISGSNKWLPDLFRGYQGSNNNKQVYWNKGWAIGYDRMICLEDGYYKFIFFTESSGNGGQIQVAMFKNDVSFFGKEFQAASGARTMWHGEVDIFFAKGDSARVHINQGTVNSDDDGQSNFSIMKLDKSPSIGN